MKYVVILFLLAFSISTAAESKQQWVPAPGKMLFTLIFDSDGEIVGTDSITWSGGGAMVLYIKTKNSFYRCVDYHKLSVSGNLSFSETGNFCSKLKK